MKGHQKYFHIVDDDGRLLPHFITISNIASKEPDKVREGNERVIRPRLADAEFFWQQDRKTGLAVFNERLRNVVFQSKLGSLYDKVTRITELAAFIASCAGWDDSLTRRAAILSKADLMTDMVGEFPELQGIMGRHYAACAGEDPQVAQAIDEHYMPRFSGDSLPETEAGLCVSLADKIDTLVGIFAIGQQPSGDKDPFALRRAALGVLRIIIEKDLNLDLDVIIRNAIKNYSYQRVPIKPEDATGPVYDFILGRLQVYYTGLGYAHDEIDAVLCLRPANLQDADKRLRALAQFRQLAEAESLAAANKRISNILKKTEESIASNWNIFMLQDDEEKSLATEIEALVPELEPLFEQQDYETAMQKLAGLRESVDAFFDKVMVMTDDDGLRANRLALLNAMRNQFLRVADLSRLQ